MFTAFWRGKNTEVRRRKFCHLFAKEFIQQQLARQKRGLATACLAAALGGSPLAHGDDFGGNVAPVIKVAKEDRANARSTLPPVINRKSTANRPNPVNGAPTVTTRASVSSSEADATAQQSVHAPGLAPVIRGRPSMSKELNRSHKQSIHIPSENAQPKTGERIRPTEVRDRTAASIPPSVLNAETTAQAIVVPKSEQKLRYGQTNELSGAVTIDLRDNSPSLMANDDSLHPLPVPPSLSPVLSDPSDPAPVPNQRFALDESAAESSVNKLQPAGPPIIDRSEAAFDSADEVIIGEPRTELFGTDGTDRLVRAAARPTDPLTIAESTLVAALGDRIGASFETLAVPSRDNQLSLVYRIEPQSKKVAERSIPVDNGSIAGNARTMSRREQFILRPRGRIATAFQPASVNPSEKSVQSHLLARQPPLPPSASPSDVKTAAEGSPPQPAAEGLPAPKSAEPEHDDEAFRPIQQVRVDIAPGKGELPQNRAATRFAREGQQLQLTGFSRTEPETHVEWDAPALCHRPLFFEDVNLERHGYHVKYIQPFLSAAHFFSRLPATPYLSASQRSRVCNYTLGHYQPGSCAPYVWYYPRPSLAGTAIEGALVTGLIMAIP